MSDSTWLRSFTTKTLSIWTDFLFRQLWVLTLSNKKKLNLFDRVFLEISAVCDLPVALSELRLLTAITTFSENLTPNNDTPWFYYGKIVILNKMGFFRHFHGELIPTSQSNFEGYVKLYLNPKVQVLKISIWEYKKLS